MIAIDNEGKVYTWGSNSCGQLGNGTNESSNEPICINDIPGNALNGKNIVEIQGNSTMIAIDNEGKVYTWGNNEYGQLGDGTFENSNRPICINDKIENELYGKKIKKIYTSGDIAIENISYITQEGELYSYIYIMNAT